MLDIRQMKQEKPSLTSPRSAYDIVEQAEKLLGTKQIADRLRVSEETVKRWCQGSGTLSDTHLLRLADLLAKYADANK